MRSKGTQLRLQRFKVEDKRRQVAEIDLMITDFKRKQGELDQQIEMEETRTGIADPGHFNYSMTAKAIRDRRANLDKSIAELEDQLAVAQEALEEDEAELRKIELMAEKEGGIANVAELTANPAHAV